jgi:hypothetical protein
MRKRTSNCGEPKKPKAEGIQNFFNEFEKGGGGGALSIEIK